MKKALIPNCITCVRILGALILLFLRPLSTAFMVVYTAAGVSDALDGFIARRMNAVTPAGGTLDSIADLAFYGVMLVRMFPVLWVALPHRIWNAVGLVIALRLSSYGVAALRFRRFASHHSWLNKATGFMVFAIPYLIQTPAAVPYCWAVCAVGGVSSGSELVRHATCRRYDDGGR